jgi:hypothetical protein
MKFVASHGGLKVPGDAAATATVDIAPREEEGFGLTIALCRSPCRAFRGSR